MMEQQGEWRCAHNPYMHGDDAQRSHVDDLARGLNAAARLVELRAAAIRAGFPAVPAEAELSLVAETLRRMAARVSTGSSRSRIADGPQSAE